MAGSKQKKNKQVKTKFTIESKEVVVKENPDAFYNLKPSWCFHKRDKEKWWLTQETLFNVVLPKLESFETQTYSEIFISSKKQNHQIPVKKLNAVAEKRAEELCIEADSLYSLRISGKQRIYGYIVNGVYNILWYDEDHGDNETCVCKSNLPHTHK